ncbi:MAG: glycerol acyltransferase [Acidimicrobiales bacterium]|nr:glycerol acyltransferase [Acidimicrobiales bacterium]
MKARFAKWILKRWGFQLVGERPDEQHTVMIASPHTSNWDFPIAMLIGWALELRMRWLGKQQMFAPGVGWIWKRMGGIPVDRQSAATIVEDMVNLLEPGVRATIVVPVSGTRNHAPYWKSGFYRIARAANVPVIMAFIDYEKKTCGVGPLLHLTGDVRQDMGEIRAFYADVVGKYPGKDGPILLREEDQEAS